jgi:branched-chain amino acid aminotransferase
LFQKVKDLQIELSKTKPDLPNDPSELKFGHKFTDHMLSIQWTSSNGWEAPKISKLKNLELHPAAKCLHYSIEIFEGMKAYYGVDKKLRLFRPDLNMTRFHKSALRSALPVKYYISLINYFQKKIILNLFYIEF